MALCLVGLGSNLGDRLDNLRSAIEKLRRHPAIHVTRVSSFIETAPVGGPPGQGPYLNAAVLAETFLSPPELLDALLAIERQLGRIRGETCGPRTIDLDLLLYGDAVITSPKLTLPHPRMHERRFVLAAAAEIAAAWKHPRSGFTVGELLQRLPGNEGGALEMRVIACPIDVQSEVLKLRRAGQSVALVPTMGALHEGHLSLVRAARLRADVVVATIFVNPTQFGPHEDLSTYPRTMEADLHELSAAKCDLVFVPDREAMYPRGFSTYVEPPAVAQPFEGVCRPGHFRGVATVVLKLFHLIPADLAFFGQKDYQQLLVIRRIVEDLALPIEIVPCPIVREPDGLALSSRNRYLSPAERRQALALSRALARAQQLVVAGDRDSGKIAAEMRNILTSAAIDRIDYIALADATTLAEKPVVDGPTVALIAAFVGTTRLIDNQLLSPH